MPIDALSVLCTQLTRDLLAIAEFLALICHNSHYTGDPDQLFNDSDQCLQNYVPHYKSLHNYLSSHTLKILGSSQTFKPFERFTEDALMCRSCLSDVTLLCVYD